MDPAATFYAYINTYVFIHNMTPLDVIQQYLLDNNIPNNYKHINAVYDAINIIANHCNTQMNIFHMNNNNNNNQYYNEVQNRLTIIENINNILANIINVNH